MTSPDTTVDPRRGLPSASNAQADSLCPGRHLAHQATMSNLVLVKNGDSEFGDAVHAAMANPALAAGLTQQRRAVYDKAKQFEDDMLTAWGWGSGAACIREARLWMHTRPVGCGGKEASSGQVDALWISQDGKHALIGDLKSLYGDVTPADKNMQLRDLAALVWHNWTSIDDVTVYINQPGRPSKVAAVYDRAALLKSGQELLNRAEASMTLGAPRKAGTAQCRHCAAKQTCPEAVAKLKSLPQPTRAVRKLADAHANATTIVLGMSPTMSNAQLEQLAEDAVFAEIMADAIKAEVRRRLELGEAFGKWTLSPGRNTEKITEIGLVWQRCKTLGITVEQFTRSCTLSKTNLAETLEKAIAIQGRDLEEIVKETIAGAVTTTTSKPILTYKP